MSSVIVIVNPVCGSRQGQQFVDEHVLPALKTGRVIPAPVFVTQHEGHAGEIVLEYLKEHKLKSLSVVVASGDGTVHEIVNKVQAVSGVLYEIEFILVPVSVCMLTRFSPFLMML
jgi:diacylglycerol kinase family enzyme